MKNDNKTFLTAIIISSVLHAGFYGIASSFNASMEIPQNTEFKVSYVMKKKKPKAKPSGQIVQKDDGALQKPRIRKEEKLPDSFTSDPDSLPEPPVEPVNALRTEPAKEPSAPVDDTPISEEPSSQDDGKDASSEAASDNDAAADGGGNADSGKDSVSDKKDEPKEEPKKEDRKEKLPVIKAGDNSLYILPLSEREISSDDALKSFEDDYGRIGDGERKNAILLQFRVEIGETGIPEIRDFISMTNNPEIDNTIKAMVSLMTFDRKGEAYLPILIFAEKKKGVIRIERKGDFKGKTIEIPKAR